MTRQEAVRILRGLAPKHDADYADTIRVCRECHKAVGCLPGTQTDTHTAGDCGGTLVTLGKAPVAWLRENAEKALAWVERTTEAG